MEHRLYKTYRLPNDNYVLPEEFQPHLENREIIQDDFLGIILISKSLIDRLDPSGLLSKLQTAALDEISRGYSMYFDGKEIIPNDYNFPQIESLLKPFKHADSRIIFKDCKILETIFIKFNPEMIRYQFYDCNINAIDITNSVNPREEPAHLEAHQNEISNMLFDCTIGSLRYIGNVPLRLHNLHHIEELITNEPNVRLENLKLSILNHTHLDTEVNFSFYEVTIDYDEMFLAEYHSPDEVLNTIPFLINNDGLASQRERLERIKNFLQSRSNPLYKALFWFNGGYSTWKIPLTFLLGMFVLKLFLLSLFPEIVHGGPLLIYAIYPYELFKSVVFNSPISWIPDIPKIGLVPIEIIYIYSVFSVGTFLKRKFGFKLTK